MTNAPSPSPPSEKLSLHLRDRFDRLFVQQLVARQFMRDYPEDCQKLIGLRNAIHAHIRDAGTNPLSGETEAQTLITLMSIYESVSGRKAISEGNLDHITANYPLAPELGIRLQENGLCEAISDMAQHLDTVNRIKFTYNHFDYFSLIDMTARFSGQSAFDFYAKAALEEFPVYEAIKTLKLRPEANWFNTRKVPEDLDLAIALTRSRHLRSFYSPNITFRERTINDALTNGKPGHSSLIFEVDLDQAPYNIDYAMRALREYLLDGLLTRHGYAANIERFDEFIGSDFFQNTDSTSALVQKWNQIQGSLIGIWCWDMMAKEATTLASVTEKIYDAQARIISETMGSAIELKAIGEKAIENHYYTAKNLIESKSPGNGLSYFVTGDKTITLGERLSC
ncbi:hypothetical protein [Noviherbaspirillum sp.]|uniref:hypothetical protein n=1 Tax=Noviherbaspirillum sp. TaxID=1926288 RepID=UPI002FE228EE